MPRIRARPMFGGVGIYSGEIFFALIADDTLYFKVDDSTQGAAAISRPRHLTYIATELRR